MTIKVFACLSVLVFSSVQVEATDEKAETRNCRYLQLSARCGDASHVVLCDGYSKGYFLANDQRLLSLQFDLFVGPAALDRKSVENIASIKNPTASLADYLSAAEWLEEKGVFKKPLNEISPELTEKALEGLKLNAVDQTVLALLHKDIPALRHNGVVINPTEDNLTVGAFSIPAGDNLYVNCEKSAGVAPLNR